MSTSTNLSEEFSHVVANARSADLPADAMDAAKKSILDTLGQ